MKADARDLFASVLPPLGFLVGRMSGCGVWSCFYNDGNTGSEFRLGKKQSLAFPLDTFSWNK